MKSTEEQQGYAAIVDTARELLDLTELLSWARRPVW
jgi:hypothetical protein